MRTVTLCAAGLIVAGGLLTVQGNAAVATPTDSLQHVAILQGWAQDQLLCPGGALQGKLTAAVIESVVAGGVQVPGGCDLADIRAANPNTKLVAYLEIGFESPATGSTGSAAAFQPSCVSSATSGPNSYDVKYPNGSEVVNPDYTYQVMADVSSAGYRSACSSMANTLLSTPSAAGAVTVGAPPTTFDGVMFDDVNMSPQHGLNIEQVGAYGSWTTDAQYGDDMNTTALAVSRSIKSTKPAALVVANVGVTPWLSDMSSGRAVNPESGTTSSDEPQRALALADARLNPAQTRTSSTVPAIDGFLREFGTQWGNASPMDNPTLNSEMGFNQLVAGRNVGVISHDYAVDLRNVASTVYTSGATVSDSAACSASADANASSIVAAASTRRASDEALTEAFALENRTSASTAIYASVDQAQPTCQGTGAAESPTTASVNLSNSLVASLSAKLATGVYRTSAVTTVSGTNVDVFTLSDGSVIHLNPDTTPAGGYAARSVNVT